MANERLPLEEMTLRQLRKVASKYNISRYSRMRKVQLLTAIREVAEYSVTFPEPSTPAYPINSHPISPPKEEPEVEASKFQVGQATPVEVKLASVDEGLAELPGGYGESIIVLMPRDPQWCYAYWDIPNSHKEEMRRKGGQQLALRIYDVTNIKLETQNPHSVQEYPCDELAREWYVPIPVSDRDYCVEIGYRCVDGRWLVLASSGIVRVPPIYPSDWIEDQFATVSWEQELAGKKVLQLSGGDGATVVEELYEQRQGDRVSGSIFGSMQQVSEENVSSYVFPSGVGKWASGSGMSGAGMSGSGMQESGAGMQMSGAGMSGAGLETMSGVGMASGIGLETMSGMGMMSGTGLETMSGMGMMSGAGQAMSGAGISGAGLTMSGVGMSGMGLTTMSGAGIISGMGLETMSGVGMMSGMGMMSGAGQAMSGAGISGAGLTMSGVGMSGAGLTMSGVGMSGMGLTTISGMGMMSGMGLETMSGVGMMSGMGMMSGAGLTMSGAGMSGAGLTMSGVGMSGAGLTMSGVGMSGMGMMSGAGMMSGMGLETMSGVGMMSGMGMMSGAGLTMSGMGMSGAGLTMSGVGMSGAGLTMSGVGMSGMGLTTMSGMGMMSGMGLETMSGVGMMSGMGMMSGAGLTMSGAGMSGAGLTMSGVGMSGMGLTTMSGMGMMSGMGLETMSGVGMMSGMGMMSGAGLTMSGAGMSGAGLTMSGMGMMSGAGLTMSGAGLTMSGVGMSGVGFSASAPPIRPRKFWLVADAELIIYGATEPDAVVTIGGKPIKLNPDGTFRFQMSFQDGQLDYPIMAVAADGEQNRSIHMNFNRETPSRKTNTKEDATLEWF
nr:DUF4912 domain-containing protein [Spirulina major]